MKKILFSISFLPMFLFMGKPVDRGNAGIPAATNKVMIVLQENGGQFVYIDDYVPVKYQTQVANLIDKIAEGFESVKSTLVSIGYYKKIIDLTDVKCTRQNLLDNLIAETKAGNVVDLYIFGHGSNESLRLYNNQKLTGGTNSNIRSLLTEARAREGQGFNFNLRLVYMCNCVGGSTNDDWVAAGADASVGSKCYNALTEPMITLFMNKFIKENKTVNVSAAESFKESKAFWTLYNSVHDLGLDNPPPGNSCSQFSTVYASSEPIVAGNGALKFNPTIITPIQFLENTFVTGGIAAQKFGTVVGTAVTGAVETVTYNATNVFDNISGTAIAEGTYYIKCYKDGKNLKVYQNNCVAENGYKVVLYSLGGSTCDNKFTIKKYGPGYTIKSADKFLEIRMEEIAFNGGKLQMWEPNLPGSNHAPNQLWWFFKIPNQPDKYLIRNLNSLKVLDANNDCTNQNDCKVKQYDAINNDPTQVWVMEKI
jgi:hypothetical protein